MPVYAEIPMDHPMRQAWEEYRLTDEYANTRRWALHEDHVDGSLWAAFCQGWQMWRPRPATIRELEEILSATDS